MVLISQVKGSLKRIAGAAVAIELHIDGTYTIIKSRYTTGFITNQILLVQEDGIVPKE
jgi:hypothetical protein